MPKMLVVPTAALAILCGANASMALDLASATSSISGAVNSMSGSGSSQVASAGSGSVAAGGSSPAVAESAGGVKQPFTIDLVTRSGEGHSAEGLRGTTQFVFENLRLSGLY
jgi:hypothetical protein